MSKGNLMYAVYSPRNEVVYGLGETRREAEEDAVSGGAPLGSPYYNPSAWDLVVADAFGILVVLLCTDEVSHLVAEYGGDPSLWPGNGTLGVDDGVLSLLPEEEAGA